MIEQDEFMRKGGWVLRRLIGFNKDPSCCWAEHKNCVEGIAVRAGHGKSIHGWYPRDNAYFGACCYCGAGCPEEIMGIYLMLNADWLPKWKPRKYARRSPKELKNG